MADKCQFCNGSGLISVPKEEHRANISLTMNNNWQMTLQYVPPEVYGIAICEHCDAPGRTRKSKPESLALPFPDDGL
jgi:hypothetical protein